jgi:hypothetical protein
MKFLDRRDGRYVKCSDVVNWLMNFAMAIEAGEFPGNGEREGQLVWNIIAGLVEQDLRTRD